MSYQRQYRISCEGISYEVLVENLSSILGGEAHVQISPDQRDYIITTSSSIELVQPQINELRLLTYERTHSRTPAIPPPRPQTSLGPITSYHRQPLTTTYSPRSPHEQHVHFHLYPPPPPSQLQSTPTRTSMMPPPPSYTSYIPPAPSSIQRPSSTRPSMHSMHSPGPSYSSTMYSTGTSATPRPTMSSVHSNWSGWTTPTAPSRASHRPYRPP